MAAGDAIKRLMLLQTDAGAPVSLASFAAFTAAGWAIAFEDVNGNPLAVTFTVADEGNGLHRLNFTEPAGEWYGKVTVPTGFYTPTIALTGDGAPYDISDVMVQILTTDGVAAAGAGSARESSVIEDLVDGDSHRLDLVLSAAMCAKVGLSNLTGATVLAAAKRVADNSSAAAEIQYTVTVTDAVNRLITITKDTFPPGEALAAGELSRAYALDVTIKNTGDGRLYTAKRLTFNVVWQADVRT